MEWLSKHLHLNEQPRFVVGIDGLSRSGKTTYVKQLKNSLKNHPVIVFHIDDFVVERQKRYHTGVEEWYEYYQLQWDVLELKDQLFSCLKRSSQLSLPVYDPVHDQCGWEVFHLPERAVVLVEGVFLQRTEWRKYFDLVIFLDCPKYKRWNREANGVKQNLRKFEERYWKAEAFYLKTVRPDKRADFIIRT